MVSLTLSTLGMAVGGGWEDSQVRFPPPLLNVRNTLQDRNAACLLTVRFVVISSSAPLTSRISVMGLIISTDRSSSHAKVTPR